MRVSGDPQVDLGPPPCPIREGRIIGNFLDQTTPDQVRRDGCDGCPADARPGRKINPRHPSALRYLAQQDPSAFDLLMSEGHDIPCIFLPPRSLGEAALHRRMAFFPQSVQFNLQFEFNHITMIPPAAKMTVTAGCSLGRTT